MSNAAPPEKIAHSNPVYPAKIQMPDPEEANEIEMCPNEKADC